MPRTTPATSQPRQQTSFSISASPLCQVITFLSCVYTPSMLTGHELIHVLQLLAFAKAKIG